MPTLTVTHEQVAHLVRQLPEEQRRELLQVLLTESWPGWIVLSHSGQEGARAAAARRGRDWDVMSEEERESLIDDLVHEDRQCGE
jgi:hypothetical protein